MNRKRIIMVISILVILFVTYLFISKKAGRGFEFPTPVVTAATVVVAPMPVVITALGAMVAENEANVASELNGIVSEVYFQEGALVEEDQLLVKLNAATELATLQEREASVALAKLDHDRLAQLIKKGATTQQEVDKSDANLKIAQANLAFAQAELDKTNILAPFKGRLDVRHVSPGQYITSGQNLVSIVDKRTLKLKYAVPQRYLNELSLGKPVRFETGAFPGKVFEGFVSFVSPIVDADTRTIVVEAHFENPDESLSPGLSGEVSQVLSENPQALSVPEEAILATITGYQVFVIKDGKVSSRSVTIGSRLNGRVEIVEGLKANEIVVARGHQSLRDGSPVEVMKQAAGA